MFRYAPEIFDAKDVDDAKEIILAGGSGLTTEERWDLETRWLVERVKFPPGSLVIDYGCGIGRIAKEILNPVLGVDISSSMRAKADVYVGRTTFDAVTPEMLSTMATNGLRAGGALSVWVLQHVIDVGAAISLIAGSLSRGAPFYLLDLINRRVPSAPQDGHMVWMDDGVNILPIIDHWFTFSSMWQMPVYSDQILWLRRYLRK